MFFKNEPTLALKHPWNTPQQEPMNSNEPSTFSQSLKNKAMFFVCLFLAIVLLLGVRLNVLENSFGKLHTGGDEIHTIGIALNSLKGGETTMYRAQDGTRLIIKALMPFAFYEVSKNMAGNILGGWQSGPRYILDGNFNPQDPNVRQFIHSLRKGSVLLFFISFIPLIWFLCKEGYWPVAAGLVLLIGVNPHVVEEQKLFYIEPTLMTLLNLIIASFLFLWKEDKIRFRGIVFLGVLSALMIATKFNVIFFLSLPVINLVRIYRKDLYTLGFNLALFCAVFIATYVAINHTGFSSIPNLQNFLHHFYSNIWSYNQSGIVADKQEAFRYLLPQLLSLTGYAYYLIPYFILVALVIGKPREKAIIGFLIFPALISAQALLQGKVFLPRNFIVFYVPFVISWLLSMHICWRWIKDKDWVQKRGVKLGLAFLVFLFLTPVDVLTNPHKGVTERIESIFPSKKGHLLKRLDELALKGPIRIHSFGLPADFFEDTPYHPQVHPNFLKKYTDSEYDGIHRAYVGMVDPYNKLSVAIVKRVGHNKNLTNAIFHRYFIHNDNWGEYYIFYN